MHLVAWVRLDALGELEHNPRPLAEAKGERTGRGREGREGRKGGERGREKGRETRIGEGVSICLCPLGDGPVFYTSHN